MWSVTTWLIVINVAVLVIDAMLTQAGLRYILDIPEREGVPAHQLAMQPLFGLGHFSTMMAIQELEIWRFLSFQFLHAGLGHIFFNMLALFFFGPMVESYLGSRRFLGFYLLCGIAGPIMYLLFTLSPILAYDSVVPMVGASAGVYGVLFGAARIAPNTTVMLLFPPIPMKLKLLALILFGIALYTALTSGRNAGGEAAHLGGALLGLVLIYRPNWLNVFEFGSRRGGRRGW